MITQTLNPIIITLKINLIKIIYFCSNFQCTSKVVVEALKYLCRIVSIQITQIEATTFKNLHLHNYYVILYLLSVSTD